MSASTRPPRRRTSSLVDEHPAYPTPEPAPSPAESVHVTAVSPAHAGTHAREARTRGELAEARARKSARDAAWTWIAAARKTSRRVEEWADAMGAAREAGVLPGVLRELIGEAAAQLGVPVDAVPVEVWRAAGLNRP